MSCIVIDLVMRFETAKSCDMGCATVLEGRFDDALESCFQSSKFRILAANTYFSEIAFSGCKMLKYEQCYPATRSICWSSGIAFSVWETFKYMQCFPTTKLICWFSGIEVLCCETFDILASLFLKRVVLLMHRKSVFELQIFNYGHCRPARGSIIYLTDVVF